MTSSNTEMYLDPEQQNLLMAALASNNNHIYSDPRSLQHQYAQNLNATTSFGTLDKNGLQPRHAGPSSTYSHSEMDMTRPNSVLDFSTNMPDFNVISPVVDSLEYPYDPDLPYDYDVGLPNDYPTVDSSSITSPTFTEHEKRKTPPTDDEDENGSPSAELEPKRREKDGEDKVAKKPGRKPLTSEPTSKRKAQNRAAQRAFRERKEKHLKDLEQKVADLEKASDNANRENSALRQQIERLQNELKEYRKKMAEKSNSAAIIGKGSTGGFQFEFPRFGMSKPASSDNGRSQKDGHINGFSAHSTAGRVRSSETPSSGAATVRPSSYQTGNSSSRANFSPQSGQDHSTVINSSYYTPKTRSGSTFSEDSCHNTPNSKLDSTTSPSASSVSHHGHTPATSPESNAHSPTMYKQDQLEPVTEEIVPVIPSEHDEPGFYCGILDDGETTFCEKLGAIACGNPRNPMPVDERSLPNLNEVIPKPDVTARNSFNISTMAAQNGGTFDPVLFNDYRDPMTQANIDLNMSFFDDAFPISSFALGSPLPDSSPEIEQQEPALPKNAPACLKEGEESDDDDEAFMPQVQPDHNLMSCNKIWDRLNSHPKFLSGEIDVDKLCVELKSKAKCSETGVVVESKDVERVLSSAALKKDANGNDLPRCSLESN